MDEFNTEDKQSENTAPAPADAEPHRNSNVFDVIENIDVSMSGVNAAEDVFKENNYNSQMFHNAPPPYPPAGNGYPQNGYARNSYNYGANNYQTHGYQQNNYQPNGYQSNAYRQNTYPQGGYSPMGYGSAGVGQPVYPAAAVYPEKKKKKLSKGGMAAIVITIAVLFILVIVFLALVSTAPSGDSQSDISTPAPISDGVSVELPISSKPTQEPKYYEDEETGLLTVAGVAKQVSPSVVDVMVYRDTSLYPYSTGSGIIISTDGYIVTNAHVVADVDAGLKVILDNDTEYKAEIVGQDSRTDIAVLKIDAEGLVSAELGDSDSLELGEMVVAIGNAGGYSGTLTVGYVSGLDREVRTNSGSDTMTCIQTDAAMSPGVSGGALINMYGQVVGITSSKYKTSELDEGIGFAITTKFAKPIIEDIISQGYISGRVRVGITYVPLDDATAEMYEARRGLLVNSIDESCDIANTELEVGDIITELNGVSVYSAQSITDALEDCDPGDTVTAHIFRKGITTDDAREFDIEFELMQDKTLS